ncbi:MAG: hypothetical protein KF869_15960 [Phycisphaeraceae bacterium]|nr:hypothetical protein [Phycisphaeraceae bacterium]
MSATKRTRAAPIPANSFSASTPPRRKLRASSDQGRAHRDRARPPTASRAHDDAAPQAPTQTSEPSEPAPVARVSPAALRIEDLVRLLRAVGSARAEEHLVRADLDAGAPVNADGTINLMHYAAWQERLG